MPREMFVTVGTGRDREDIGKALALSIRHHRADRVWFLATLKSQDETLPIIRRELGSEGPPLEALLVEDENDAELCQRQFQKAIAGRTGHPGDRALHQLCPPDSLCPAGSQPCRLALRPLPVRGGRDSGSRRRGLRNDYDLLRDLGDPLGSAFCQAYVERDSPLRKRLEQRNNSILAHGAGPVNREAASELLQILEGFTRGEVAG